MVDISTCVLTIEANLRMFAQALSSQGTKGARITRAQSSVVEFLDDRGYFVLSPSKSGDFQRAMFTMLISVEALHDALCRETQENIDVEVTL